MSTQSGVQLKELEPKQLTHKVVDGDKENNKKKVVNNKVERAVTKMEILKPPPSFPQSLRKQKEKSCYHKLIDMLKQVHINLLLVDVLQGVPKYAKYIKDIVTNKNRLTEYALVTLTEESISRIQNKLPTT